MGHGYGLHIQLLVEQTYTPGYSTIGGRRMKVGYCQCENIQWIWANDSLPTAPCSDCGCQITWSED
jgi:hypothetical protein